MNKAEIEELIKELLKDNERWISSQEIGENIGVYDNTEKVKLFKVLKNLRKFHEIDWKYFNENTRHRFLYKKVR